MTWVSPYMGKGGDGDALPLVSKNPLPLSQKSGTFKTFSGRQRWKLHFFKKNYLILFFGQGADPYLISFSFLQKSRSPPIEIWFDPLPPFLLLQRRKSNPFPRATFGNINFFEAFSCPSGKKVGFHVWVSPFLMWKREKWLILLCLPSE